MEDLQQINKATSEIPLLEKEVSLASGARPCGPPMDLVLEGHPAIAVMDDKEGGGEQDAMDQSHHRE
jgi:hypothetical protein